MPLNIFNKALTLVISSILLLAANNSQAAKTSLITASLEKLPSSGALYKSAISADGLYVVFSSTAENLVSGDTFGSDIFLHDRTKNKNALISIGANKEPANASSDEATISANGRFVAFTSAASNLVSGDVDNRTDIFVFDRITKLISCISCNSSVLLADSDSYSPSLSADGQLVAFASKGWNGSRYKSDIFVHDRQQNKTTKVSVNSAGKGSNSDSSEPFISANGRFVAFSSWASNLVPGNTSEYFEHHVFVRDLKEQKTIRVSVDSNGVPGDAFSVSSSPTLNADGRFVAFASRATNLVPYDTNFHTDIFVHDQLTGKTKRISVDSTGNQSNADSHFTELSNPWIPDTGTCGCVTNGDPFAIGSGAPSISADGRYIAFDSNATNLVSKDLNTNQDVFLHDLNTATTRRISVDTTGKETLYGNGFPSMSADGRVMVFSSKSEIIKSTTPGGVFTFWNPALENIYAKDLYLNTAKKTDLGVTATHPPHLLANNMVESTFKVSNKGLLNADGVTLTDVITAADIISLTPSQGSCSKAGIGICRFGTLNAGKTATLTVRARATANTARQQLSVNANVVDNVPGNNLISSRLFVTSPMTP